MKRIIFNLQNNPNEEWSLDADIQLNEDGDYTVREEQAFALIIYNLFPQLKKSKSRIKRLIVIDENDEKYCPDDFDIYGSLKRIEK